MKTRLPFRPARPGSAAYALIMVMVILGISLMVLGGVLTFASSTSSLSERNNRYTETQYAAEAATQKPMAKLIRDYMSGGEASVVANLTNYSLYYLPASTDDVYWAGFEFNNGNYVTNQTFVQRVQVSSYVTLKAPYTGLYGYASTYRIVSNAKITNNWQKPVAAVQQDIQIATIPLFQFALFYNNYLDLNPGSPMVVNGRVHANGAIWTGPGVHPAIQRPGHLHRRQHPHPRTA